MRDPPPIICRRTAMAITAAAIAWEPRAAMPADVPTGGRARLSIAIGSAEPEELEVGLFDAAPASAALFQNLCTGAVPGEGSISYVGSTASRIEKDRILVLGKLNAGSAQYLERSIDGTGYVRSELVNRAERWTNSDPAGISHDRPGLVSMRRGGGAFEFALSPRANPSLDAHWVVIGEIMRGQELLEKLNNVPARKPTATGAVYGAAAKASGDVRSRVEQDYRPLLKVQIVGCRFSPL